MDGRTGRRAGGRTGSLHSTRRALRAAGFLALVRRWAGWGHSGRCHSPPCATGGRRGGARWRRAATGRRGATGERSQEWPQQGACWQSAEKRERGAAHEVVAVVAGAGAVVAGALDSARRATLLKPHGRMRHSPGCGGRGRVSDVWASRRRLAAEMRTQSKSAEEEPSSRPTLPMPAAALHPRPFATSLNHSPTLPSDAQLCRAYCHGTL